MSERKDSELSREQANWREKLGLTEDTVDVRVYLSRRHKEEWKQEAEEREFSLSKYVIRAVNEWRSDRKLKN